MSPSKRNSRLRRFARDIYAHTPFLKLLILMIVLWVAFAAGLYVAERHTEGSSIDSLGAALYWGVAAFSTAGIADTPRTGIGLLVGGVWIIVGSTIFFGTIVATITSYFMRPMQRPGTRIIDTIEYNLEQLNDLTIEELDLLKETVDTLIVHVERLKRRHREY